MMKKIALIIIFIFIILPLILLIIIGADAYLTISNFSPSKVSLQVGTPQVSLSSDNTSLTFSTKVNLTTPQAGFIPKGANIVLTLWYNGTTQLGQPIKFTLQLGKTVSETINQTISLPSQLTSSVSQGKTVSITVKTQAHILVFGITIPYDFKVPDQTFNIP